MRRYIHILAITFTMLLLSPAMVQAQSEALPLGSALPMADGSLSGLDGSQQAIASVLGENGTVFIFWSNRCLWIDRYEDRLVEVARAANAGGMGIILVNANDYTNFPEESADATAERTKRFASFATVVLDNGSQFATALGATRTPHVFLFDRTRTLVYEGAIDDSPGDPSNVAQAYLSEAIQAVRQGQAVAVPKTKAFGCTLKPVKG